MTKKTKEPPLSYRSFFPHQPRPDDLASGWCDASAPVLADSVEAARRLLKVPLENLQVMENGQWRWVR